MPLAANNLLADNNGLHQERRPAARDANSPNIPPLLISMNGGRMFMARTYRSVTQVILTLALREYNRQLAIGRPAGEAAEETKVALRRSGVDEEVAQILLEQIKAGTLEVDALMVKLLEEIATAKAKASAE